ncbi:MAG: radical SAM protein [Planctomycetota bacterium]
MTRVVDLLLGPCDLGCPLCERRRDAPFDLARALAPRPDRVVLRGAGSGLAAALAQAKEAGVGDIVVRTHALDALTPERARAFAARGAHAALVPLFSSAPSVHDRIVARPGALAAALVGLRALAEAGVALEIEIPLLPPRLQRPEDVVALAHRAAPSLRAARLFVPAHPVPAALVAPAWRELREGLTAAVHRCRALGVRVELTGLDGIPLCALRDDPSLADAYRFDPRRPARRRPGWSLPASCEACTAQAQCPGLSPAALAAHGDAGLAPFAKRPRELYAQRTPGAPVFTAEHRRLAATAETLVLRPTVHCNQDCPFCSANETSGNLWERPGAMLRALARAARRGLRRVSFGGGEPTLARDLRHYVQAARRLGIPEIEVVTNGVLLDRPERVRTLREAGLTHAFVSLHAHDEQLSQSLTRKIGDHARTVQAIGLLLDAGVETVINHVVTARNAPHLARFVDFVRESFRGRALISVAFVTPQYKALEDPSQMPRYADVAPHLRRALYTAIERGQPVQVGSRQGIPPCLLGEFRAWSDVLGYAGEPGSEDAPQKVRAPGCDTCRYARVCTGVWRPYADRHGTSELSPLPGPAFTDDERHVLADHARARSHGWPVPVDFAEVHPLLRAPAAELHGADRATFLAAAPAAPAAPVRSLPVLATTRQRPLRAILVGAGRRAQELARAARTAPGLALEAVVSPHAHLGLPTVFGDAPGFASLAEALDALRPEALVIATPVHALASVARAGLAAAIPCLLPRPFARTTAEVDALLVDDHHRRLMPALPMLWADGLEPMRDAGLGPALTLSQRIPNGPRAWSRDALAPLLYDALTLACWLGPGGRPHLRATQRHGAATPERIRLALAWPDADASVELDLMACTEETLITRGNAFWRHSPGHDNAAMLTRFVAVARGEAIPSPSLLDVREHLAIVVEAIEAIEAIGAPFERPDAPRHARSPTL